MNTILVPVDFSEVTGAVLENAEKMARALEAEVYLLHIEAPDPDFVGYKVGPDSVRDSVAKGIKSDMHELHVLRDSMREKNIQVESLVIQGVTVEKILEEAIRLQADLVIMGSHGRSALMHLLMGSVCEGVIKDSTCPVVVVPASS